jgi:exonuclease III
MIKQNVVYQDEIFNLQIFSQNIGGLVKKTEELAINWPKDAPHILCLSEHHLPAEIIKNLSIESYKLGAFYCRKNIKCGGVCIYTHKSHQFINLDLDNYCLKQDIEVCAIRLNYWSVKFCILFIYRSPSGNFDTFLRNLEELLNKLLQNQSNLNICGNFKYKDIFEVNTEVHGINTRQKLDSHVPSTRLMRIQKGLYYSGITLFNA